MEGNVFVENEREDKAGSMFDTEAKIEIKGNTLKYVSRGGLVREWRRSKRLNPNRTKMLRKGFFFPEHFLLPKNTYF